MGSTAAQISAVRLKHSTNSAARHSPVFKRNAIRLQRHLPRVPLISCFRPQNCSAAAHALAETGRVEDDQKLSRVYSGFYLQGDRSTTYAERAADTKLARLRRRPRGRERDCRFRRKPLARDFGSLSKPRSFGGCCCGNFRLGLRQHGPQRDRERDKRLVEIRGGEQSCGRYFSVLPWSVL